MPLPVYLHYRHQNRHCQIKFPGVLPILDIWGLFYFTCMTATFLTDTMIYIAFPILTNHLVVFSLKMGLKKIKWHQEIKCWPSASADEAIYKRKPQRSGSPIETRCSSQL